MKKVCISVGFSNKALKRRFKRGLCFQGMFTLRNFKNVSETILKHSMAILNINLRKSLTKNTLQYILNTGSSGFFRKIKEDSIPHTGLSAQGFAEIFVHIYNFFI